MIDCPALHERLKGYPYGNRVPSKIRMSCSVYSDVSFMASAPKYAQRGNIYDAWMNSYGAVAAVMEGGKTLGVKPGEFEVIEWHEVT